MKHSTNYFNFLELSFQLKKIFTLLGFSTLIIFIIFNIRLKIIKNINNNLPTATLTNYQRTTTYKKCSTDIQITFRV